MNKYDKAKDTARALIAECTAEGVVAIVCVRDELKGTSVTDLTGDTTGLICLLCGAVSTLAGHIPLEQRHRLAVMLCTQLIAAEAKEEQS